MNKFLKYILDTVMFITMLIVCILFLPFILVEYSFWRFLNICTFGKLKGFSTTLFLYILAIIETFLMDCV